MDNKITKQELMKMQSWTVNQKIDHALGSIDRFTQEKDSYVSFSGGKKIV